MMFENSGGKILNNNKLILLLVFIVSLVGVLLIHFGIAIEYKYIINNPFELILLFFLLIASLFLVFLFNSNKEVLEISPTQITLKSTTLISMSRRSINLDRTTKLFLRKHKGVRGKVGLRKHFYYALHGVGQNSEEVISLSHWRNDTIQRIAFTLNTLPNFSNESGL